MPRNIVAIAEAHPVIMCAISIPPEEGQMSDFAVIISEGGAWIRANHRFLLGCLSGLGLLWVMWIFGRKRDAVRLLPGLT